MATASASTTGGSVKMSINERMKLIPYETLVGLTSTILAGIVTLDMQFMELITYHCIALGFIAGIYDKV